MSSSLEQRTVDAVRRLGLARPRDLTRLGLRREYVQRLTERGALVRVARGLSAVPDAEISTHRSGEVSTRCGALRRAAAAKVMRPYPEAAG